MKRNPFPRRNDLLSLLCAGVLIVGLAPVAAGESTTGDGWQYAAPVYLWGAGIKGETANGSNVDVGFDTLIDNLNMAFMGSFDARKSRWSFLADVVYLNVGAEIDKFVWAPGRIVWDGPGDLAATGGTSWMLEGLHRRVGTLEVDLLIESPYFVPRDRGIGRTAELTDRGVRIRVLTNSLASNDVLAAHAPATRVGAGRCSRAAGNFTSCAPTPDR